MSQTQILVIEDAAAIRQGLVDALAFGGYGVFEAGGGRDRVDLALCR